MEDLEEMFINITHITLHDIEYPIGIYKHQFSLLI